MWPASFHGATVLAQAAEVRELDAVQGAQPRNFCATIQVKEHAASATGAWP